jgi:hypothetical protein
MGKKSYIIISAFKHIFLKPALPSFTEKDVFNHHELLEDVSSSFERKIILGDNNHNNMSPAMTKGTTWGRWYSTQLAFYKCSSEYVLVLVYRHKHGADCITATVHYSIFYKL